MFTTDDSTLGGRLRAARTSTGEKIRDFAPKVDVTANYLSLIERGVRNPSDSLVRRIADATGKDFRWLMYGQKSDAPAKRALSPERLPIRNVKPRLFLTLILLYCHDMPKEQLASMLMVPLETLDRVLDGDDTEFRTNWGTSFSLLSRNLDIPVVRKDLEDLVSFLKAEEQRRKPEILICSIREYLRKTLNLDYQLCGPIDNTVEEYDTSAAGEYVVTVPCATIPMSVRNDPLKDHVLVRYFPNVTGENGLFEAMAEQEAQNCISIIYYVFVFDKKPSYARFVDCMQAYCSRQKALAGVGPAGSSNPWFPMSVLLVDEETMEIKDKCVLEQ